MRRFTTPLSLIGALVLWEAACRLIPLPPYLLPAPTVIAMQFWAFGWNWWPHIGETLLTVFCGFSLSVVLGFTLAVAIARSATAYKAIYPFLVIKQSTPIIAIAPIIVVMVGTGLAAKAIVACMVSLFPIVVATATGLMATPKEYLELARSVHDDRWKALLRIRLPFAVRYIFGGLRVGITLAVVGAVVAELVSSGKGLGYLVYSATAYMQTGVAFAALLLLSAIGLLLFTLVGLVQKALFPWAQDMPGEDDPDA
jgi:NitT/TauT family transport system permease protein